MFNWIQSKLDEKDAKEMYNIGVQDAQDGEEYSHPFGPATKTHQDTTHLANAYDKGYRDGTKQK
jgi:hypothetical protein